VWVNFRSLNQKPSTKSCRSRFRYLSKLHRRVSHPVGHEGSPQSHFRLVRNLWRHISSGGRGPRSDILCSIFVSSPNRIVLAFKGSFSHRLKEKSHSMFPLTVTYRMLMSLQPFFCFFCENVPLKTDQINIKKIIYLNPILISSFAIKMCLCWHAITFVDEPQTKGKSYLSVNSEIR